MVKIRHGAVKDLSARAKVFACFAVKSLLQIWPEIYIYTVLYIHMCRYACVLYIYDDIILKG